MPVTPGVLASTVDLVDLNTVKSWLNIPLDNTDDDSIIQFVITSFSTYVLNKCGKNSLNSVQQYAEIYDGNGAQRLFLINSPIVTLVSVLMGTYLAPISTALNTAGVYIEQSKKSIAFRTSTSTFLTSTGVFPYIFSPGQGNIQVTYTAGYTRVPADLVEAVFEAVSLNYRRKDWIDLASKSLSTTGGTGTTAYHKWALTPSIERVLDFYSRYARP